MYILDKSYLIELFTVMEIIYICADQYSSHFCACLITWNMAHVTGEMSLYCI